MIHDKPFRRSNGFSCIFQKLVNNRSHSTFLDISKCCQITFSKIVFSKSDFQQKKPLSLVMKRGFHLQLLSHFRVCPILVCGTWVDNMCKMIAKSSLKSFKGNVTTHEYMVFLETMGNSSPNNLSCSGVAHYFVY